MQIWKVGLSRATRHMTRIKVYVGYKYNTKTMTQNHGTHVCHAEADEEETRHRKQGYALALVSVLRQWKYAVSQHWSDGSNQRNWLQMKLCCGPACLEQHKIKRANVGHERLTHPSAHVNDQPRLSKRDFWSKLQPFDSCQWIRFLHDD